MVNLDGEKWENDARNKQRNELRSRIERTRSGLDWILRVDYIGKDNPPPSFDEEDDRED